MRRSTQSRATALVVALAIALDVAFAPGAAATERVGAADATGPGAKASPQRSERDGKARSSLEQVEPAESEELPAADAEPTPTAQPASSDPADSEESSESVQPAETAQQGESVESGQPAKPAKKQHGGNGSVSEGEPSGSGRSPKSDDSKQAAEDDGGSEPRADQDAAKASAESGALASLAIGEGDGTLDSFDVPVSLLPLYQACGTRYEISWEVLAAINSKETGFGSNLGVSGAGAEGWMQFLPSTWKQYGVDADGDGRSNPDDPFDAICAAARYLAAAGGEEDIEAAVYAYNHSDSYVREVLSAAREYERVPANLINSLTELASGSTGPLEPAGESVAASVEVEGRTARISAAAGARVVAVADGVVRAVGESKELGRYVVLRDELGDRIVYSGLGQVSREQGERVSEGEALGRAGGSSGETEIGFSVQPSGSAKIDPEPLLRLWAKGGVGKVYGGAAAETESTDSESATQTLLMSRSELERRVLADPKLTLPRCERAAVQAGGVRRQVLAALEYMTAQGFEIAVARSSCEGSGFSVEIEQVGGAAPSAGTAAEELVDQLRSMKGAMVPQRVEVMGEEGGAGKTTIQIDYEPPGEARLVDGKAVAPTNAPAAVQAMIAAANQIADEPYVWGGGHGSWVSDGYDCSGAVSYVLHAAERLSTPLTSAGLASWGEAGAGRWVTVYANGGHTYAVIAGLRWDTSGNASGTGPRWHEDEADPSGYSVRHPTGL